MNDDDEEWEGGGVLCGGFTTESMRGGYRRSVSIFQRFTTARSVTEPSAFG